MIANLEKTFGNEVIGLRKYLTPGTPGQFQVRETNTDLLLPTEKHSKYRTGVGMLQYVIKTRPDLANPIRELSKVLDGPTEASYKEMLRIIKFTLDTRNFGLLMCPKGKLGEPWEMVCYTNADYAGDPVTRRSVTGYIIFLHGVPVCFCSRSQKSVTLSSCESEWIALSEAVKDVMFILHLCESMQIEVKLPVTVRVDNVGAIFMTDNVTTTARTRHVDTRTKYVREFAQDGTLYIKFVASSDNIADIMTKNVSSDLHEKHSRELVSKRFGS